MTRQTASGATRNEVTRVRRFACVLGVALGVVGATAALTTAETPGNAARGEQVFASKQCAHCHRDTDPPGAGPRLAELRRPQGAYELTGRFWNHAPAMFTALKQEHLPWPV